jgi:hypothetical protein
MYVSLQYRWHYNKIEQPAGKHRVEPKLKHLRRIYIKLTEANPLHEHVDKANKIKTVAV